MKIDYLTEDTAISGQNYCLISFVSPQGNQKCDVNGVKIRGSFDTLDEANARASQLREIDPDFDIYVAAVGRWLPWYPDASKVPEIQYQEEQLNNLVKGHKENEIKSKQHFEQRKRDLMERAMEEGSKEGQEALSKAMMHPLAVKTRMEETAEAIKTVSEQLETLKEQHSKFQKEFSKFTEEDIKAMNDTLDNETVSTVNKNIFESENISRK